MYEEELQQIIEASQNNALTFFVGAGVSKLSGVPTWKDLTNSFCDKLGLPQKGPSEDFSSDESLRIPQIYYDSLSGKRRLHQFLSFVKGQLLPKLPETNNIHKEMFNLNPASFLTTNYDTLLEEAAIESQKMYKAIARNSDVPDIFGDRFILKVHGDFKHRNIVLKEDDYLNYSETFKLIETLIKSIFATNTVVFIGYSLSDYNIKLILNWSKSLLKGKFRKPIFINAKSNRLSERDLTYWENRGLSVIECIQLNPKASSYLELYQSVFDAINHISKYSFEGKTEGEAFDILYNLLKPLNRLPALRIHDVSAALQDNVIIGIDGIIRFPNKDNNLMKKFLYMNSLLDDERDKCTKEELEKYNCIISVFKKARITRLEKDNSIQIFINESMHIGDPLCLLFDYKAMRSYVSEKYTSITNNYIKAYYLFRMQRYEESFWLFLDIAKKAYIDKDLLIYYLAMTNCSNLYKIMNSLNQYGKIFDLDSINKKYTQKSYANNLFGQLPISFQKQYQTIKDINVLSQYSFDAFQDGQKLQKAIESNSMEFGLTSSMRAMCRINDYLHFLTKNGIVSEVFAEYRIAVNNLMSLLVYKYSTQDETVLHDQWFPVERSKDVYFDEIDFYCFVTCFTDKEIVALLNKYHIETIRFENMYLIQQAIENLIEHHEYVQSHRDKSLFFDIDRQFTTCIALMNYMSIPQVLVDRVCKYLLSHEFSHIYISDKIRFLDSQLAKRKMYSEQTRQIVEKTLIEYIDKHIQALQNNQQFNVDSRIRGINYYHLVYFMSPEEIPYTSRKLSSRVSTILSENLSEMYPETALHYFDQLTVSQKKNLISLIQTKLSKEFNFQLFDMLINYHNIVNKDIQCKIKDHLRQIINTVQSDTGNPAKKTIIPYRDPYHDLIRVGYWCFMNKLKKDEYKEFLGHSDLFDFYIQYTDFDFSKFNLAWLLSFTPAMLKAISENDIVKSKIRKIIADTLKDGKIIDIDRQQLYRILVEYCC